MDSETLGKPADVFDRDAEWADLADFLLSPSPGLRIAVVYGRRRQGKSYLLRRLADAVGGLYHLATEQAELVSLRRFGDSLANWARLPAGSFGFGDWEPALRTAAEVLTARAGSTTVPPRGPSLLVLDEFPYLMQETPGLPSIVQSLYDNLGPGAGPGGGLPLRLILCGSAISVMGDLLSGTKALRGRAALEQRIRPFGYRDTRCYWEIENPMAAFAHHALIGGTPGYRELVLDPRFPEDWAQLGSWLARNVLRPSMPLFDEARRVVHEDPRIRDAAAYSSVLAAVAAGESSPTKIGGLLGRPATSLAHQLDSLASAGFIDRRHDLLLGRRPVITVADPMVRLHQLVIEPYQADLEAGRAREIWGEVTHTVDSKIFGPHFEALAADWVARYAAIEAGLPVGPVGQTDIACREHKTSHEIDVLALARGARPRTAGAPIAFIGEAKHRDRRPGLAELRRLEHLRELLTAAGHDAAGAVLGLFSTTGFTQDLIAGAASGQGKILLTSLELLYGQHP
ncbi:MAG TPA: ATP-binding protein [Streptosporangiaceae bacterium]